MKNVKFLFVAMLLSVSAILAPASAGALSDSATVVVADDAAPQQCTIKIKGTVNGDAIDVAVTVEADNCAKAAADFLRQLAKK